MGKQKMRVYVGNMGAIKKRAIIEKIQRLGQFISPGGVTPNRAGDHYGMDNGAYGSWVRGEPFNPEKFQKILGKCTDGYLNGLDFAVCPDIVAGGYESLQFSLDWIKKLPNSVNWYLAVQDGMDPKLIEPVLGPFKGIFVGGTMEWKEQTAKEWVDLAHKHGKKCHIGRVGTKKRLAWAESIHADSCDSTNFSRHEKYWNDLLEFIDYKSEVKKMSEEIKTGRPSKEEVPEHGQGHIIRIVIRKAGPNKGKKMTMRFYKSPDGKVHSAPVRR